MRKPYVIKVYMLALLGNTVVKLPIPKSELLKVDNPYDLDQQRARAVDFAARLQDQMSKVYTDDTVDIRPRESYQHIVDLRDARAEPSLFLPKR